MGTEKIDTISAEELTEEITKDFYQPDYFSKFKINGRKRRADISAVIPTYNRCPFDSDSENYKYNPLAMAITALLMQKATIKEIIIIDDASTDYTEKVVKDFTVEACATKGVEIKYFKNLKRMGSSVSRNIGAKHASAEYLFFLDDDCVPTPYLSFVSMIAIKKLEKRDSNFAVLVLPVYDRASFPRAVRKIEDLTRTFFKRENMSASLNSIPLEYTQTRGNFLNKTLQILEPIKVYQTWGHFIVDRSKYLDVGGFPDFAVWPNKAGEEQEFACKLIENAYNLYYLPDPKASSYHGAYGARLGKFTGKDWMSDLTSGNLSLVKFSEICDNGIMSGNRVDTKGYIYSRIIATFCIIYKRNTKEAINWAKRSYQDFVALNKKEWYPAYARELFTERKDREEIWHMAISNGLNLLFGAEQKRLAKLNGFIKSLKKKGQLEEHAQKNMLRFGLKKVLKKLLK